MHLSKNEKNLLIKVIEKEMLDVEKTLDVCNRCLVKNDDLLIGNTKLKTKLLRLNNILNKINKEDENVKTNNRSNRWEAGTYMNGL